MNHFMEGFYPGDDLVRRRQASRCLPLDPPLDSFTAYLHEEMRQCYLNGLDHAAILAACALIDSAIKASIYVDDLVSADGEFKAEDWDRIDALKFGAAINMAKSRGVVTKDEHEKLEWLREHIRNPYMHGETPPWSKEFVPDGVMVADLHTGEAKAWEGKLRDDITLQRRMRLVADRNACCQVVPLVDGLVRVIGKRALDKLNAWRVTEGDKVTSDQIKTALDKMLDQGFVPDQIITSGIPEELMPKTAALPRIEEATMSIRSRVEDSQALMSLGRADGALLSALVAVAATSRKRYPKSVEPEDGKAFTRFLGEEMRVLTAGAIVNVNVAYPGADPAKYPDRLMPLQDVLYKFVRCALIHEGGLPGQVEFIPVNGLRFQVLPDKLILTQWLIQRLHVLVQHAPENIDEFPEIAEVPADVIGWVLFGPRRPNHADYLAAREERLKAVKTALEPQAAADQQPPSEPVQQVSEPNARESS